MQAMYEQNTEEVAVALISVDNPDDPGAPPWPLRVADHPTDIVSNGETYMAGHFELILPDQEASGIEVSLKIGLFGPPHVMVKELRAVSEPPLFQVAVVLESDPDTILHEWIDITLRNVEADNVSIIFELRYEQLSETPFPGYRYSLPLFPGLF
jgi:hypothetical protein